MFGRRGSCAVMMTLILGVCSAVPVTRTAQAAASTKLYRNTAAGFSMSYPANWAMKRNTNGAIYFLSPDQGALVAIGSLVEHPTVAQIQQVEKQNATAAGAIQGKISYGSQTINGIKYQAAQATIKLTDGSVLNYLALDVIRGKYNNLFSGLVTVGTSTAKLETTQVINALLSITFK